jgi:hypothetical protein
MRTKREIMRKFPFHTRGHVILAEERVNPNPRRIVRMGQEERKLNAFEAFFASCNVRFALLVVLHPPSPSSGAYSEGSNPNDGRDLSSSQQLQKLKDGTINAIQSSRLGRLQLVHKKGDLTAGTPNDDDSDDGAEGSWYLAAYHPGKDLDAIVSRPDVCLIGPTNYGQYLDDRVINTDPASNQGEGPIHVEVLRFIEAEDSHSSTNEQRDVTVAVPSTAVGLYVNSNHAICDGRSLLHFASLALQQIQPLPIWTRSRHRETDSSSTTIVPPDWKDLVQECTANDWNDVPPFLGTSISSDHEIGNQLVLSMQELSSTSVSDQKSESAINNDGISKNRTLRLETPSDVMRDTMALLRYLKDEKKQKISLTGLLVAIIMKSIATEYYRGNGHRGEPQLPSREIGVSVLVDLRPFLLDQNYPELPQAIGTVTLLLPTDDFLETMQEDYSGPLLRHAERLTSQLKQRIRRGEAHRSALALANGNFEAASPPATLELSNLGVCSVPTSTIKIFTAQRFDGYDGVSCMVHSETSPSLPSSNHTNIMARTIMRWCVSTGDGLNADGLVERIFSRVVDQLEVIAKSVCIAALPTKE